MEISNNLVGLAMSIDWANLLINYYINVISIIINAIIASAAIWAVIQSTKTYKQAENFRREEKESRKAFIAPAEEPGFVELGVDENETTAIKISTKNYGVNPISEVETKAYFFILESIKEGDAEKTIHSIITPFDLFYCKNPMASGGSLNIMISQKEMMDAGFNAATVSIDFVVLRIVYEDAILDKKVGPIFLYWHVNETTNKLFEVDDKSYIKLKKLIEDYEKGDKCRRYA